MQTIEQLIATLQTKIDNHEKVNKNVSASSVGWHIEHVAKVLGRVTTAINNSDPANFKSNFSFARTVVFAMNKIPRGKGRAPDASLPDGVITKESLQTSIAKAKEKVKELYKIDTNKYFEHPYFGQVQLKGCIKFLTIHTNHHLKIINDILK